jgi:hypothetical protein
MGIKQVVELAADIRVLLTRSLVHSPTVDLCKKFSCHDRWYIY